MVRSLSAVLFAAALAAAGPAPRPELEVLKLEEGTWDADITFPPAAPGQPEGKAKGVQTNVLRSDGMWMVNSFQVEGTPYQGTGVWGWDPAQARYVGVWVDNNESRIRRDLGTWDPARQEMTWTSEMVQADGSRAPLRFVEAFKGRTRTFTMVAIGPKTGKEYPLVKMVFTRRD